MEHLALLHETIVSLGHRVDRACDGPRVHRQFTRTVPRVDHDRLLFYDPLFENEDHPEDFALQRQLRAEALLPFVEADDLGAVKERGPSSVPEMRAVHSTRRGPAMHAAAALAKMVRSPAGRTLAGLPGALCSRATDWGLHEVTRLLVSSSRLR
jgi:hypothetical protein